jgi:simple sugar transport system substrate-binding protein
MEAQPTRPAVPAPRRQFLRNALVAAAAVPGGALLLDACASAGTTAAAATSAFGAHRNYKFTLVTHFDTNIVLAPCHYGAEDACNLLGSTLTWTGSTAEVPSDILQAMDTAIQSKQDGVGIVLFDPTAFNDVVAKSMAAGIPTVAFNSDVPAGVQNDRMAYIGQDLEKSGVNMADRLLPSLNSGDTVAIFDAVPGSISVQPRVTGLQETFKASGKDINFVVVDSGILTDQQVSRAEAWYQSHPDVKVMIGAEGGSTYGVVSAMKKFNLEGKVIATGWDPTLLDLEGIPNGTLNSIVDQQLYLQGFLTILSLFLYQVSGGLLRPADTDTGEVVVTKANVSPYLTSQTRYEGETSKVKVLTPPSTIAVG